MLVKVGSSGDDRNEGCHSQKRERKFGHCGNASKGAVTFLRLSVAIDVDAQSSFSVPVLLFLFSVQYSVQLIKAHLSLQSTISSKSNAVAH